MGSSTGATGSGDSTSPKQARIPSPPRPESKSESKPDIEPKTDAAPSSTTTTTSNAETTKPLAPPPRPGQPQPTGNTPDLFAFPIAGHSLNLEPNPFEQSFSGAPETPGGTKLPSVAALTSPSSLLPGSGTTPFWGAGSLRTGPLSPAMLSGPTNDYFSSDHIRGGFPTPNESSLRTGLTPGGSGSMFPAPSPNSQALFAQLAGGPSATPGALEFHRTALSISAAKREQESRAQAQQPVTSQPQPVPPETSNGAASLKGEAKASAGPFDPHDNDAANGLYMLARGQNGAPPQTQQYPPIPPPPIHAQPQAALQAASTSPQLNGNASIAGSSARGVSEALSAISDESEIARPNTRAKNKRGSGGAQANSRRKADDSVGKGPANKKSKTNGGAPALVHDSFDLDDHSDDDDMKDDKEGGPKSKMTDEEKRKNFLERNRVAALKCRQRKKAWLASLQNKVEMFSTENEALNAQITALREEVVNLKTLLLAHKDCPVTQSQGMHGSFLQQASMEPYAAPMNAYALGGPMQNQAVLNAQPVGRRYS